MTGRATVYAALCAGLAAAILLATSWSLEWWVHAELAQADFGRLAYPSGD